MDEHTRSRQRHLHRVNAQLLRIESTPHILQRARVVRFLQTARSKFAGERLR